MSTTTKEISEPTACVGGILIVGDRILAEQAPYEPAHYRLPSVGSREKDDADEASSYVSSLTGMDLESRDDPIVLRGTNTVARYYRLNPVSPTSDLKHARDRDYHFLHQEDVLLRYTLKPFEVVEIVVRAWTTGASWPQRTIIDEESRLSPLRVRSGAIVIDDLSRVLLIRRGNRRRLWYEIPGGGVHTGESPEGAALRELVEETGLVGTSIRHIATVYKQQRVEFYHLIQCSGRTRDRNQLDLRSDAELTWIWIGNVSDVPVWPKRLAWRLESWYRLGWPTVPIEMSDSISDEELELPCVW